MIEVKEIFSADIYRDGGSRSFCFHGNDGEWYEFFMPIRRRNGKWDGYCEPKLYLRSMNDGNSVRDFTWDDAIEFVHSLKFDNDRFHELVSAVQQRGESGISPTGNAG